jgi:hypothetical protein
VRPQDFDREVADMGRIIKTIEIEGQPAVALFHTGAMLTYVRSSIVAKSVRKPVAKPVRVALGGQAIEVSEQCLFDGKIEGLDFFGKTVPVQDLGKADGHHLDAIIGATTMEEWEIKLDPHSGTLDLEGLRRREFTEY